MKKFIAVMFAITLIILVITQIISRWLGIGNHNQWYWLTPKIIVSAIIASGSFELSACINTGKGIVPEQALFVSFVVWVTVFVGALLIMMK